MNVIPLLLLIQWVLCRIARLSVTVWCVKLPILGVGVCSVCVHNCSYAGIFLMDLFTSVSRRSYIYKYGSFIHTLRITLCSRTVCCEATQSFFRTQSSSRWMYLIFCTDRQMWIVCSSQTEPCWCAAAILWEAFHTLHSIDGVMTAGPHPTSINTLPSISVTSL